MPWPPGGGQVGQYGGLQQPGFHPGMMHPAPELGRLGPPPAAMRGDGISQNCARTQQGMAAGDMPGAMHWPEGKMAAWIETLRAARERTGTRDGPRKTGGLTARKSRSDPPHQVDLDHWAAWGAGGGAERAGGSWNLVPQRHERPTRLTHAHGQRSAWNPDPTWE